MIHLTFQIVSGMFSLGTAGIYYWLIKREIRKRKSLDGEIESLSRALTHSEKMAKQWSTRNGKLMIDIQRAETERDELRGQLMAKQGASLN